MSGFTRSRSTERVMALLKSPEMKRMPSPPGPLGFLLWGFVCVGVWVLVDVAWGDGIGILLWVFCWGD